MENREHMHGSQVLQSLLMQERNKSTQGPPLQYVGPHGKWIHSAIYAGNMSAHTSLHAAVKGPNPLLSEI